MDSYRIELESPCMPGWFPGSGRLGNRRTEPIARNNDELEKSLFTDCDGEG